jgi:hypothetical protein
MAGRYVLIEFDDREAAETFTQMDALSSQLGYRRLGLYVSPRKFCECPEKRRQNAKNWVRGKRTGLQLCVVCRKPSIFHQRGLMERIQHALGFNLIEIEDTD